MSNVVLECKDLYVGYGDKVVLGHIELRLRAGELAVLIGSNGSGKSTFLRTISGLQKPIGGGGEIGGKVISRLNHRQLASKRAIVSTDRSGGGALTVAEAVGVGRNSGLSLFGGMTESDKKTVAQAMDSVGITAFADRYLAMLSDGERQKVMIARALAQDTPLIFLDEPTAFLDVSSRMEIIRLLYNLSREGKTIVLSTHDIAPAMAYADTVMAVVKDRKRIWTDSKEKILSSGILDEVFSGSGLHFEKSILDYR